MTETKSFLTLPRLISDGMVIQRERPVKIWGWAEPNSSVCVKFLGSEYTTEAGAEGSWEAELPPLGAGGPFEMEIRSGDEAVVIRDILVGDVWLTGGQSNMELPMYRVDTMFPDEIANSTNPSIREFRVPQHYDFKEPQSDIQGGVWASASPETVPHFSAVGYFLPKLFIRVWCGSAWSALLLEALLSKLDERSARPVLYVFGGSERCTVDGYIESVQQKEQQAQDEWYSALNEADKPPEFTPLVQSHTVWSLAYAQHPVHGVKSKNSAD